MLQLKTSNIEEDYYISDKVLGIGITGNVIECICKTSQQKFALKILPDDNNGLNEINMHNQCLDCENIVKMVDCYRNVYDGKESLLLIMECLLGGELYSRMINKDDNFTEREVALIMYDICKAVNFLHSKDLVHRDLKPENLLYSDDTPNAVLKLIDLGFAKLTLNKSLQTPCYTAYYVAPEILSREKYDKSCDMWSLGVMMYILLCGYPPFYSKRGYELTPGMSHSIICGDYIFPDEEWSHISQECKNLIKGLLKTEPESRLTIKEVMDNHWIKQVNKVQETKLFSPQIMVKQKELFTNTLSNMCLNNICILKDLKCANNSLFKRRNTANSSKEIKCSIFINLKK